MSIRPIHGPLPRVMNVRRMRAQRIGIHQRDDHRLIQMQHLTGRLPQRQFRPGDFVIPADRFVFEERRLGKFRGDRRFQPRSRLA